MQHLEIQINFIVTIFKLSNNYLNIIKINMDQDMLNQKSFEELNLEQAWHIDKIIFSIFRTRQEKRKKIPSLFFRRVACSMGCRQLLEYFILVYLVTIFLFSPILTLLFFIIPIILLCVYKQSKGVDGRKVVESYVFGNDLQNIFLLN